MAQKYIELLNVRKGPIETKLIFISVLLELCESMDVRDITVNEILDKSGFSRQTFYNHFKDKYDLINYVYEYNLNLIIEIYHPKKDFQKYVTQIFQSMLDLKPYYSQIILMDGQNNFKSFFLEVANEFYMGLLNSNVHDSKSRKYMYHLVEYTSYGSSGLCMEWIKDGMLTPPNEMSIVLINSIHKVFKKYLNIDSMYYDNFIQLVK